jgi:hypothetical protein
MASLGEVRAGFPERVFVLMKMLMKISRFVLGDDGGGVLFGCGDGVKGKRKGGW